jgi:hypothetical protein
MPIQGDCAQLHAEVGEIVVVIIAGSPRFFDMLIVIVPDAVAML